MFEDSNRVLRNRTVGRSASSSYRDIVRIRPAPYPPPNSPSSSQNSPRGRTNLRKQISLSPLKLSPTRNSPTHSFDRFIPQSSSQISLRHLLSSPPRSPQREGSQSPTNPQRQSPGKPPEWPNSYNDTLHSYRLASALELPISPKMLHFHSQPGSPTRSNLTLSQHTLLPSLLDPPELLRRSQRKRFVPPDPFRILDAPDLRDDYYAQPLSWSVRGTIAVALGMEVFLWSPQSGVSQLPSNSIEDVTAVAFNPTGAILAIAREDGSILLQAPNEGAPRIHIAPLSQGAVGALAWRPGKQIASTSILTEFLIIGTFDGRVVLCEITWDVDAYVSKVERRGLWDDVHTDQICGIAWSNDGLSFATGANDNKVCTFEIPMGTIGLQNKWEKKYEWTHDAAVKGLAYKSGKGGVLAAGGGVNDKKIRFYNTHHGTLLSSLDVSAQITMLQWSASTTEILATFGYTAPGISTKCAVYAYPSLQCLFDFEIADDTRALYAVISPCGRDICVAGSDECVRFYRIWGDIWNKNEDREKSPVRDLVAGVDPQMSHEDRTRRLRSGLSVLR